jgi:L-fuconate dehydratase
MSILITDVIARDIRFPTSRDHDGSDAMHTDPDYSAAYVILKTNSELEGHGLTFTIGRGNEICVAAIEALAPLIKGKSLESFTKDMGAFYGLITGDSQLRWVGPEKGVIHLATAAVVNAVWDLFAKAEGKPLWKLLVDMSPEELVRCINFRYVTDAITPEEALAMLKEKEATKAEREAEMRQNGYPAYITSAGWLGYSDEKIRQLCNEALAEGWHDFKIKVGRDLEDDIRRCRVMREVIGPHNRLMMDANQYWDVQEAIDHMRHLAQLMQADAIGFCQLDSCRLGGVNEVLVVYLMAAKFGIPVCPHAGGVGLCEYVQHLQLFDYICVTGDKKDRLVEYVDHLHEHFVDPCVVQNGCYMPPLAAGYSITMKPASIEEYSYPDGKVWQA